MRLVKPFEKTMLVQFAGLVFAMFVKRPMLAQFAELVFAMFVKKRKLGRFGSRKTVERRHAAQRLAVEGVWIGLAGLRYRRWYGQQRLWQRLLLCGLSLWERMLGRFGEMSLRMPVSQACWDRGEWPRWSMWWVVMLGWRSMQVGWVALLWMDWVESVRFGL